MKKSLILLIALAAACTLAVHNTCQAAWPFGKRIKGSERIVTKNLDAPDFDALSAARGVRVVLSSEARGMRIDANDNLIDWVVAEVNDGTLEVTIDKAITSVSDVNVTVTLPAPKGKIRSLEATSSARIESDATLKADRARIEASSAAEIKTSLRADGCAVAASSAAEVEIELTTQSCSFAASSAAKIRATVETSDCSVTASSAAKIIVKGETGNLSAKASSAADIAASELAADNASAEASSGAGIDVNCRKALNARASSGADIRYRGDCSVESEKSSGGSVRRS